MTEATKPKRPHGARSIKVRPQAELQASSIRGFPPPNERSEKLTVDNLPLAIAMARRMARQTNMPYNDLFGVACQGLIKGCRKYDPDLVNPESGRPYRLSTIVVPYIRGEMMHYLRDKGHSSGVKFPDRWRDIAPTVRKMAKAGSSFRDINEATGLPVDEIEEILTAQGCTNVLNPDIKNNLTAVEYEPDELDEVEFYDELAWTLQIADQAHDSLRWADRAQIETQWNNDITATNKRRHHKLAKQQHRQFLIKARKVLAGAPCPIEEQNDLILEVPIITETTAGKKPAVKKLTTAIEILEAAEQLLIW